MGEVHMNFTSNFFVELDNYFMWDASNFTKISHMKSKTKNGKYPWTQEIWCFQKALDHRSLNAHAIASNWCVLSSSSSSSSLLLAIFFPNHQLCCLQFSFLIIIFVACYLLPNHHLCWACYSSILICLLCLLAFRRVWYIRYKLRVMVGCNLLHEISYPSSWKTKWSSSSVCFSVFWSLFTNFFCLDRRRRRRRSPRHHLSC
jgi:hypothetical protein